MTDLAKRRVLIAAAAACGALTGCRVAEVFGTNSFKDDPVKALTERPDPIAVLRDAKSTGDRVAKALQNLDEPARDGGTPAEQTEALRIVHKVAISDERALCRLAAIDALGRFRDPRAVGILKEAYTAASPAPSAALEFVKPAGHVTPAAAAGGFRPDAFPPEVVSAIRCQVLNALGEHKHPDALPLLAEAARSKAPDEDDAKPFDMTPGQARDIRLAAVRALGKYPNRDAAVQLAHVLETERDAALRSRAQEGLVRITGRDNVPPNAKLWHAVLRTPGAVRPESPGLIKQVGRWVGSE